jgi:two-component system, OmpR family, response regulator VicR
MSHSPIDQPAHRHPGVATLDLPCPPQRAERATSTPALLDGDAPIRVLVVEDDQALVRLLTLTLRKDGYQVTAAGNGREALRLFAEQSIDLILLDIDMPVMNGFDLCAELRKSTHVPIIFVTAKSRPDDLLWAYQLGGDSYITKPFTLQELRARIGALLRRIHMGGKQKANSQITIGEISLDEASQEVTVRGEPVSLTPNEYRLLSYLMRHPGQLITKAEFLAAVWQYESTDDINFMRVTIRRLRSKIEADPANPCYLKTVHGVGYQFCADATTAN